MLLRLFLRTLAVIFFIATVGAAIEKMYISSAVYAAIGMVLWRLGRKRRPKRRRWTGPTDFDIVDDRGGPPPMSRADGPVYMTGREFLSVPWGDRRATDRHKAYAASLGIVFTEDVTAGELHDAGAKLHKIPPTPRWQDDEVTEPQMRLADRLGIRFSPTSTTRGQISAAITAAKRRNGENDD